MAVSACKTTALVFRLHESTPPLVRQVLLERDWVEFDEQQQEEGDWNLYWCASAFRSVDFRNLLPWQRLNHHPETLGITRKDCLARNLKRMRGIFGSTLYNFSPTAFILPNNYTRFVAEYTKRRLTERGRVSYWICKPVDLSRGRGIFIFEDMKDLTYDSPVIVQRYISNPLLISGYKFDLRIYVCVKSFHPLTIYIHQEGLVRFATEKYSLASLDNLYAHLTNTSINKFGPCYTTDKERVGQGCKWTMSKFRSFLRSQDVDELLLWQRINSIVTLTMLTIAPSVPSSPNCVELFGFDILIDANLKPWLLEVNYSPALTLDCAADVTVKKGVLNDLIDVMNYKKADVFRRNGHLKSDSQCACHGGYQPSLSATSAGLMPLLASHRAPSVQTLHFNIRLPSVENSPRTGRGLNSSASLSLMLIPRKNTVTVSGNRITQLSLLKLPESNLVSDSSANLEDRGLLASKSIKKYARYSPQCLCGLPAVRIQKNRSLTVSRDKKAQGTVRPPPFRVGDFILTFPFNEVTLRASQEELNVKAAVQEVHQCIHCLTSLCGHGTQRQREGGLDSGMERDNFPALFWGPKNPPLLSDCCLRR